MEKPSNEHISCEPTPECPWFDRKRGCFEDVHHLYYPASDYQTTTEQTFRDLPDHRQRICRRIHEIIQKEAPLEKPSREEMLGEIALAKERGQINLSKNKQRKIFGN